MTAAGRKLRLSTVITNDPSPRSEIGSALVPMLGLCTVVLVTGALSVAELVLAPLAFGLFVIAIVWPLQKRLQVTLPRLLALALTMAATILVVVAFTLLIAWAAGRVGRFIVSDAARLQALYGSITAWLEGHGIALAGLWTDYFSVDQLIRLAQRVTAGLNSAVTFSVVVFIYVLLGLLEVDDARLKLGAWRHGKMGEVLLAGSTETCHQAPALYARQDPDECHDGSSGLGVRAAYRATPCRRVGRHCVRTQLHPVYRPIYRDCLSNPVRDGAVRVVADGGLRFRLSQRHPIRGGKLPGAAVRG